MKPNLKLIKNLPGPVLVTGHTGFKGTWLLLLLKAMEIPVYGYALPPKERSLFNMVNKNNLIAETYSDITNFNSINKFISKIKPSIIIHLAAQPLVLESYKNPRSTFETNVMGTVNVLESSFNTSSVQAILISTTDKVYKNTGTREKFKETDPLQGSDPYSSSKVATEAVISAWQKIHKVSSGPLVLAARAGNVIGGGDFSENRLIPDLMRGFYSQEEVHIRNPSSTRPWQHVIDPLYGYLRYIEESLTGTFESALNFGPLEGSLSVQEVVKIAQKAWGHKTKIKFESTSSNLESHELDIDPKLAMSKLNWKQSWTQKESIESTVNWWKKVLINKINADECCVVDIEKFLINE